MSRVITAAMLRQKGACLEQVNLFSKLFPNGSPETKRSALVMAKRYSNRFDWCWAATSLLSRSARKAYHEAAESARKAYEDAAESARKAYEDAIASAWKAYNEAIAASAWKAYHEAIASAWKAYEDAAASAWKAYHEAIASAFVEAWFSME